MQLALDQTMLVYQCAIDSSAGGRWYRRRLRYVSE